LFLTVKFRGLLIFIGLRPPNRTPYHRRLGGVYHKLGGAKPLPHILILLGARGALSPMLGNVSIFEYPGFASNI